MRNRVSISYIPNYDYEQFNTYVSTIFFAHNENNVYKNGKRFTYFSMSGSGMLNYRYGYVGTFINNKYELNIVDTQVDRYKYTLIPPRSNRYKILDKKQVKFGKNKQNVEMITTSLNVGDALGNDNVYFTYYPNFIEGFSNTEYSVGELYHNVSTNNNLVNIGERHYSNDNFNFTDPNYADISSTINHNVRDLHNGTDRITGIGIIKNENRIYAGVDYDDVFNIYVMAESGETHEPIVIYDNDVYSKLDVTLLNVDRSQYKINTVDNGATTVSEMKYWRTLSLKNVKHIGNVLMRITLNWRNNKFEYYEMINFSKIVDKIFKFDDMTFIVNDVYDYERRTLLIGDKINYTYLYSDPGRADQDVELTLSALANDNYNYYNGTVIHDTHANRPYEFKVSDATTTYTVPTNADEINANISYNKLFNPVGSDSRLVSVCNGRPNNVHFTNMTGGNGTAINSPGTIEITNNSANIVLGGSFTIADDYKLKPKGNYNRLAIRHKYNNSGYINTSVYDNTCTYTNTNSYSFKMPIGEPGKYEIFSTLTNGAVVVNDQLGEFSFIRNLGTVTNHVNVFPGMAGLTYDSLLAPPTNNNFLGMVPSNDFDIRHELNLTTDASSKFLKRFVSTNERWVGDINVHKEENECIIGKVELVLNTNSINDIISFRKNTDTSYVQIGTNTVGNGIKALAYYTNSTDHIIDLSQTTGEDYVFNLQEKINISGVNVNEWFSVRAVETAYQLSRAAYISSSIDENDSTLLNRLITIHKADVAAISGNWPKTISLQTKVDHNVYVVREEDPYIAIDTSTWDGLYGFYSAISKYNLHIYNSAEPIILPDNEILLYTNIRSESSNTNNSVELNLGEANIGAEFEPIYMAITNEDVTDEPASNKFNQLYYDIINPIYYDVDDPSTDDSSQIMCTIKYMEKTDDAINKKYAYLVFEPSYFNTHDLNKKVWIKTNRGDVKSYKLNIKLAEFTPSGNTELKYVKAIDNTCIYQEHIYSYDSTDIFDMENILDSGKFSKISDEPIKSITKVDGEIILTVKYLIKNSASTILCNLCSQNDTVIYIPFKVGTVESDAECNSTANIMFKSNKIAITPNKETTDSTNDITFKLYFVNEFNDNNRFVSKVFKYSNQPININKLYINGKKIS